MLLPLYPHCWFFYPPTFGRSWRFCLFSGLKPDIRYMIVPHSNFVIGCQPSTPGLQSYQNVICLSNHHQFILCCQPVFPMHHLWVQVIRYLHSTGSIATAPSTSSAEEIIHRMFRSFTLYILRGVGWSTVVINHCMSG